MSLGPLAYSYLILAFHPRLKSGIGNRGNCWRKTQQDQGNGKNIKNVWKMTILL
jgi:hypothetical protein